MKKGDLMYMVVFDGIYPSIHTATVVEVKKGGWFTLSQTMHDGREMQFVVQGKRGWRKTICEAIDIQCYCLTISLRVSEDRNVLKKSESRLRNLVRLAYTESPEQRDSCFPCDGRSW